MSRSHLSSLLIPLVFVAAMRGQDRKVIGIVQTTKGGWTLQGKQAALKPGQLLQEGDTPFVQHSTTAKLTIALLSRSEPWQQLCTAAAPCEGPYTLPKPTQNLGFWSFLTSYFNSDSKVPAIFAGSRGIDSPGPKHAVLALAAGQVDLSATLAALPVADYMLRFTPQSTPSASPQNFNLHWDGISAGISRIQPGFYALDVYARGDDHQGTHAAVLIVPATDTADQKAWQDALSKIKAATGRDSAISDELRLATVLAIHDGQLR